MEENKVINEVVETVETVETEQKTSWIEKGKNVGGKVLTWSKDKINYIKENPTEAISKVGAAFAVGVGILYTAKVAKNVNDLEKTVYSDDIGEGVVLKKKLNNDNKVELDYRMKTGQTKIEALKDMDLIK